MGVLSWVLFGLLAGWLASVIVKDNRPRGCFTNMLTGIVGALLGGFIYQLVTRKPWTFDFTFASFGVAVLGSILLIVIINAATKRR